MNLAISKSPERSPEGVSCVICHWIAQRNPVLFEFNVTSYSAGDYVEFRVVDDSSVEQFTVKRYPKISPTAPTTGTIQVDLSNYLHGYITDDMQTVFNPTGGAGGATGRTTPFRYNDGTRQFKFKLQYRVKGTGEYTDVTGVLGTTNYTVIWAAKQILDPYGQNMLRYYPTLQSDGSNLVVNGDFSNELTGWTVRDTTSPRVTVVAEGSLDLVFAAETPTTGSYDIEQSINVPCANPELCITFTEPTSVEVEIEFIGEGGSYLQVYGPATDGTFCDTLTGVGPGEGLLVIRVSALANPANVIISNIELTCPSCFWQADFLTEFEQPKMWKRLDGGTGVQEFAFPFISSRDMEEQSNMRYEWLNSLGGVISTQNVTHDTGSDKVLNMDFDNQAVGAARYVRVSVQDSFGNEYFNPKTIAIEDCLKNGVYLRWVNKLGGDAYWMFVYNQERTEAVSNDLIVERRVEYLENENNPLNVLRKSATESMILAAESITLAQEKGLQGLRHSPKVEMYLPDVGEWIEVLVEDGQFALKPTKQSKGRFLCTIRLAETYIQRR